MARHQLDALDKKILKMIAADARVPFLEVARACNVSGAAIHQRVQKLFALGVLKGSQFIVDPESVGFETCAYIGLYLKDPSSFEEVTLALKKIPEVVECHFTTGNYTMLIKMFAFDNAHLMDLLNNEIQQINGVTSTETLISLDESINRQLPIVYKEECQ